VVTSKNSGNKMLNTSARRFFTNTTKSARSNELRTSWSRGAAVG